jgi:hypothetical protein
MLILHYANTQKSTKLFFFFCFILFLLWVPPFPPSSGGGSVHTTTNSGAGGASMTLEALEESSIARLEAVSGNFALVGSDARDDLEDLTDVTRQWSTEDDEAREGHAARELELMNQRRERGTEQVQIIDEVQRLLRRYAELQAANEADSAEMARAAAQERRRRDTRETLNRSVSARMDLLANTARNADIAVRIAAELRDTVSFWLRCVADLVASKETELQEAERFITLRAAQAYTDFYLVTRRLIFIQAERLAKARRDLDHARAEKAAALSMLNQPDVDSWGARVLRGEADVRAVAEELSRLEGALAEERGNFAAIEATFTALAITPTEDPEARWREDEQELRGGLEEAERRRVETWQTAVLGLLRAGREAENQIAATLGNVMIANASFASDDTSATDGGATHHGMMLREGDAGSGRDQTSGGQSAGAGHIPNLHHQQDRHQPPGEAAAARPQSNDISAFTDFDDSHLEDSQFDVSMQGAVGTHTDSPASVVESNFDDGDHGSDN